MTQSVGPMASWGATWMVVTGASRGLGAEICDQFAGHMAPGSVILGLARTDAGLQETAKKVQQKNPKVQFVAVTQDLSKCDAEGMCTILEDSLRPSTRTFDRAILVHNAGSLGKLDYMRSLDDFNNISEYFNFNISSLFPLTTLFLRTSRAMSPCVPQIHVINASSLCALSPTASWGLYCVGKAARDMMCRVLAAEEPEVHVLNYAPGCLDTAMQEEARASTSDPELKTMMRTLKAENKLVQLKDTVAKLVRVLEEGKYSNGDHVDYYDE